MCRRTKTSFTAFGEAFVHGEALALPVHGVAQAAHLAGDGAAGLRLPLPDFVDERVAAVVVAGFAFFRGDLALHHHLGGDAGVVGARLPQGVFALHALVADHGVHDGLLERVAHVQAAGDVRRRDHDAEAFLAFVAVRLEIALLFPVLVQRLFDMFWVVCGVELAVCLFHSLSFSVSWRRSRGQMEADAAVGFIAFARQLFQRVFVRDEVYHFM